MHGTCDGTTVHSLTPGRLVVTPGNLPGARYLPQHPCHPSSGPSTDRTRHLKPLSRYTM
ncbi:putative YcjX-like family ATPase [Variovorax sp. SG517]|nr:putative YcjX-like family ATPase [Variovorax sp. SG517]